MIAATPAALPAARPDVRLVHVLRWSYRRHDEAIECKLALTADDSAYELRLQPPWKAAGATVELFDDATAAFQRHGIIERLLIGEGWSLESFESTRVER